MIILDTKIMILSKILTLDLMEKEKGEEKKEEEGERGKERDGEEKGRTRSRRAKGGDR